MMTLDTKDIEERERLVKEIAHTSKSIRKKHRALKTGRMVEEADLEKHFKPIVEPLKQIAENIGGDDDSVITDATVTPNFDIEVMDELNYNDKRKQLSSEKKSKRMRSNISSPIRTSTPLQPRKLTFKSPTNLSTKSVFETTNPSFVTSVRRTMQTSDGREALYGQLGPLGQEYIGALLSGDKKTDQVYGVYFNNEGTQLGDKRFDIDKNDNIIVDSVIYAGTPGLFELIFKRIPDDAIYTEDDKQKYRSILLATNAHRRGHNMLLPVLGNKGYKYKNIIAPLMCLNKRGGGVMTRHNIVLPECSTIRNVTPQTMTVTNKAVDYVHWDDPNELVDRLRLLDASRQAGNNAHDNEFLSIIEELREAGLIIN
ncbi:uncharacterized protein [Linepithema humile]|uniref:uncharacterized protein n=1 Tax=Linepithema humile TaxID=83485 RepID=UPI00351F63C5